MAYSGAHRMATTISSSVDRSLSQDTASIYKTWRGSAILPKIGSLPFSDLWHVSLNPFLVSCLSIEKCGKEGWIKH